MSGGFDSFKRRRSASSWKVAYADFVTALMAFFLLMWIINMVPPERRSELTRYFQTHDAPAGGAMPGWRQAMSGGLGAAPRMQEDEGLGEGQSAATGVSPAVARRLRKLMAENPRLSATGEVLADETGVMLRVTSDVVFKPGQASFSPDGEATLAEVTAVLREYNLYLVIRGHADNAEAPPGSSAWDLSATRSAAAAKRILETKDGASLLSSRLRAVAYADTRPLLPANTPENVARNRRVEFYFHRPEVMSHQVVY